jgi:hypothetical protein
MFALRFDMRAPAIGAPATDLYAAAIDMCSWAAAYLHNGRPLPLLPLCGGVPPEVAWPYLERAVMAAERA